MTIDDAISTGMELLQESAGTQAALTPRSWRPYLKTALNEVGQAADGFYYSFLTDLVSGQSVYCAPMLYKIIKAAVRGTDGITYPLPSLTAREYADLVAPGPTGRPTRYVTQGENNIVLWPTPDYSTTGTPAAGDVPASGYGLTLEGYAHPGTLWADATTNPTGACPIGDANAQMAAIYGACILRCIQMEAPARIPALTAEKTRLMGLYEGAVATRTPAQRQRSPDGAAAGGAYPDGLGFDPLGRF